MEVHGPHRGGARAGGPERNRTSFSSLLKRSVDVVVSGSALALTLPIMLVAAVAIRLDSAGPVIVRHVRVGTGGRTFELYQLRSTVRGGDEPTRVGRVLRWASIDELPHLWNVLRGDMSLVGPRPTIPEDTGAGPPAGGSRRLRSVPGLTGTWSRADDPGSGRRDDRRTGRNDHPERGDSNHRAG